jgi:outer membrane receptor protein involved in Fe transport
MPRPNGSSADWLLTGGLRHSQATYKVTDNYVTDGNQDDSGTIDYDQQHTPLLAVLYRLTPAAQCLRQRCPRVRDADPERAVLFRARGRFQL